MTDLMQPDAVRDQGEVVMRRPPLPAKRRPQLIPHELLPRERARVLDDLRRSIDAPADNGDEPPVEPLVELRLVAPARAGAG